MQAYHITLTKEKNITFNKGELYIPPVLKEKSLGVDGDLKEQIAQIQAAMA